MELNWQLTEKLKKYYIIIYTCWNVIAKSEGEIQRMNIKAKEVCKINNKFWKELTRLLCLRHLTS